ncbi:MULTISPECIES: PEP-CTERM sorting domain-containing protein [unclassified Nitrosospira]|uniref:PEP-CTERM sorting domain-containing protein n=1 Tax=unclassified Nitrosospira TaxID=2609267 RepID=UPI000D49EF67|nr:MULTISPECIES: PEP-CTERM sorting domain-containing protein [unclassified Nitrosospira]PTR13654.1 putative secreted protein with PEP-CTERM sorting signal [Nitrosospira sp. Nsp2]WON72475.1 PEPxxWA-CTERM sorting domain-containing protein [Nitrosospira sp. Is2]
MVSTTPGVVGSFNGHAFVTGPNGAGMTDLNSLVSLPANVVLTAATAINNHGQVVVNASIVPEPETYALMLAGLGLIGFLTRRKNAENRT